MLLKICNWLASKLPGITISLPDPTDGIKKPYLSRYYFFGKNRRWCNLFLHHFHRSDAEIDENGFGILHNHPWLWSFSLILIAGYSEERLNDDGSITRKTLKPWSINMISAKNFHRVDLIKGEAWTLFFTGPYPENNDWFFYNRTTKEKRHWKTSENAIA